MKKKFIFALCTLALLQNSISPIYAQAQTQTDQRTNTTKIADLLAQLPANSNTQFEKVMKEIANLGQDGYVELIKGLNNAGNGRNILEYAVAGFSAYATKNGQEDQLSMAVNAYCKVLPQLNDKNHVAFIISQFDILGNDNAVPCIANYLKTEPLADETARALAKIATPKAIEVLLSGLDSENAKTIMASLEGLASTQHASATAKILPFANHSNPEIVKTSLFALANMGDASAEKTLLAAAEKANFKYSQNNATAALLAYATRLVLTQPAAAKKIASYLLANAKQEDQVNVRTAALEILSRTSSDHTPLLLALKDKNFNYRAAAINYASNSLTQGNTSLWISALKKAEPLTQVAILNMLGTADAKLALPEVLKLLKSKNADVQKAAIQATLMLGQDAKIPDLLEVMNKGTDADIAHVSEGLLRMPGQGAAPTIAAFIPNAKPEVQVALLKVLAARAANDQIEFVYDALKSDNPSVKAAAFNALKSVATVKNTDQLLSLLRNSNDATELTAIQEAIIASNKGTETTEAQLNVLLAEMDKSPEQKKQLFYKIMASLGGDKALKSVANAFATGDVETKKASLAALSTWKDASAASEILKIARTNQDAGVVNQALLGYLQLIKKSNDTPEQRLLQLRNAMDLAKSNDVKTQVLKDVVQAKSYHAILFAGKYLEDPALQQAAAQAVMNITMAGKYNGDLVKGLLNKTIEVITGPDAGYQKEGMRKYLSEMQAGEGFVQIFNGKDLSGWQGLVLDPIKRSKLTPQALAEAQAKANIAAQESWKVINGELHFMIKGDNLATIKKYGDIEMLVDWKIIDDKKGEGDAGIYLRGTPQVQIWDLARTNVGAQVGSGGLYNNQKNPSKPLLVADNPLDEWNTFRILMVGDRVTVYLNGKLVTDNVILENYWNRNLPIFSEEQIELQAHGSPVAYRDIYIREIPRPEPFKLSESEEKEGFKVLFDGTNMHHWVGNTTDYILENGNMAIRPKPGKGSGGNLFTKDQYSDFNFRFEFQLTPGANNGLGIRSPLEGDPAYVGMELQILDNDAPIYKNLKDHQYHGSIYGVEAAKRGFLKPVGEWNYQEVIAVGSKIKVILNGTVIVDADIEPFKTKGTIDGQKHPGLLRESGHIGFLGHGSPLQFRNIRIKDLSPAANPQTNNTKKK